jgi:hypothetical protein
MKEVFSANWIFQIFFKLAKVRAITINCVAYYRDDKEDCELWLRLHESFHAIEQHEQGLDFYKGYAWELFKEWKQRHDERQAIEYAEKMIARRDIYINYDKTDDEYLAYCCNFRGLTLIK